MTNNKVDVQVREIRRRTASFRVAAGENVTLTGRVNAKTVSITRGYSTLELPKTYEAINALSDLVDAIRLELGEQGVLLENPSSWRIPSRENPFKVEEAR